MIWNDYLKRENLGFAIENLENNHESFLKEFLKRVNEITQSSLAIGENTDVKYDKPADGLRGILFWDTFTAKKVDLKINNLEGGSIEFWKKYKGNSPLYDTCVDSIGVNIDFLDRIRLNNGFYVDNVSFCCSYDGKKVKSSFSTRGNLESERLIRGVLSKDLFYKLICDKK